MNKGESILQGESMTAPTFALLRSSELVGIIEDLSKVDYAAEGWAGKPQLMNSRLQKRHNPLKLSNVFRQQRNRPCPS